MDWLCHAKWCTKEAMSLRKGVLAAVVILGAMALLLSGSQPARADRPQVVVSEFMASNDHTLVDEDGTHSDWIELYNPARTPVDLAGWYLTDDFSNLTKWRFPPVALEPGEYLIVFASDKNRPEPGAELHTNFRLSAEGEYLALVQPDGQTIACDFFPEYPEQRSDVGYGLCSTGERYFSPATPGAANGDGLVGFACGVTFSREHGFYETPFSVTLSTPTARATIRYTLDGSIPDRSTGNLYTSPISIDTTTCLRAVAFADSWIPSPVTMQTYIFLDDVLRQPSHPAGFPDRWGWDEFADPPEWTAADYAMDPAVVAAAREDVIDALLAIPTISLTMDRTDLFSQSSDPTNGGIYANPMREGVQWERPASVELIYPDGSEGFQVNCGVRIYGGMGRAPWAKKHTFRLLFKSEYGPTELEYPLFGDEAADTFNTLILRANFNDGWHMLWDHWKLQRVQLVRDEWARATQIAMGSVGSHGMFVHLYIDGLYWGIYNPVERPDAAFSAGYLGGDPEEWDSLHDGEPVQGDRAAWEAVIDQANSGLGTNEAYQRIQGNNPDTTPNPAYDNLVDVINLADYMLLNFYAGTEDWDIHNWYAGRRRTESEGYKLYVWDAEITHLDLNANLIGMDTPGCPSRIFQALRENVEFRMLFADRVQQHLFNDGALSAANAAARYRSLTDFIDRAVVAESARWGDTVRESPYTRDREWIAERDAMLYDYFPQRGAILLRQLRDADLFPDVSAPVLAINGSYQHGGSVSAGDALSMSAESGSIWYTLDGSDPRLPAGTERTALVPQGAEWQFLDDGSDQGTAWRTGPVTWPGGSAEFGYGDGDERTVVNCCPSGVPSAGCAITTYFRHTFVVDDASEHDSLVLRLVRDDGAVVYLNRREIVRSNMPVGMPVLYDTPALDAAETESSWFEFRVDPSDLLADGENVLAVEVHQWSPISSDISFDLELLSGGTAAVNPSASEYTRPIALHDTTRVMARVLADGVWSALIDVTFTVDDR
jgi:hypothetical protein